MSQQEQFYVGVDWASEKHDAWVTDGAGKRLGYVRRHACHPRLANALYHWARVATQCNDTCRDKYEAQRLRGHSHGCALRSVADRLLNVASSMLRSCTLFDPSIAKQKTAC